MTEQERVKTKLLMTVPEVAEALSLGERTVRRLVAEGQIDSVLIGSSRRISLYDLQAFVTKLENRP